MLRLAGNVVSHGSFDPAEMRFWDFLWVFRAGACEVGATRKG